MTAYGLDCQPSNHCKSAGLSLFIAIEYMWHPPSFLSKPCRVHRREIKQSECEFDPHIPIAKVQSVLIFAPASSVCFHVMMLSYRSIFTIVYSLLDMSYIFSCSSLCLRVPVILWKVWNVVMLISPLLLQSYRIFLKQSVINQVV